VVLHGEGRGKISSPHLVNNLGTKSLTKWGGMIRIGSFYYLSSIVITLICTRHAYLTLGHLRFHLFQNTAKQLFKKPLL
jgi:hypothetical protein